MRNIPLLHRLVYLKKMAARLSIIAGAAYGIVQYERVKLDGQLKQTLSLYDKFNSAPFSGYRENLTEIAVSLKNSDDFARVIIELVERDGIKKSLNMTLDFFDGVKICMENEICDRNTARDLFKARANEIYQLFFPYIEKVRKQNNSNEYAKGLSYVSKSRDETNFVGKTVRFIVSF